MIFDPEQYGMVISPSCGAIGFIQNSKRRSCPKGGGFGYMIKEAGQDSNTSKNKIMSPSVIKGEA